MTVSVLPFWLPTAEDQRREALNRGPGAQPASVWRWTEYGPVGARWLDNGLLRRQLEKDDLVDRGSGATWSALAERSLLRTCHRWTGLVDARSLQRIVSVFIRLTTRGRKAARLIKVTDSRVAVDSAACIRDLAEVDYPKALVNASKPKSWPWEKVSAIGRRCFDRGFGAKTRAPDNCTSGVKRDRSPT
jgi:hypothetical protein